jgi:hypothetical protein
MTNSQYGTSYNNSIQLLVLCVNNRASYDWRASPDLGHSDGVFKDGSTRMSFLQEPVYSYKHPPILETTISTTTMKSIIAFGTATLVALAAATSPTCEDDAVGIMTSGGSENPLFACDSAFSLVDKKPAANPDGKCTNPVSYNIKQTRVTKTDTRFGEWTPLSGCNYCGLSAGNCVRQFDWTNTTTASFDTAFDLTTEDSVLKLINQQPALNRGKTWTTTDTKQGNWECEIPPGNFTRLFIQIQQGQAISETRILKTTTGCGNDTVEYSSWTGNQGSTWALHDNTGVNLGCSSGASAGCSG